MNPFADYLRYLALMAVCRAGSGHIGLPLGCAEVGVALYENILRFDSSKPTWPNRDRFVLSAGHGSMLLYGLNHLFGYPIGTRDLADFRQLGSPLCGHPERDLRLGIETTTGPLGQGVANAVGLAIEGKRLAKKFDGQAKNPIDYGVYVLAGDGCIMEGICYEAASLAGHLQLDNLVLLYDSNDATIDGPANLAFSEDVLLRFEAMQWAVSEVDLTEGEAAKKFESALLSLKDRAPKNPKCLVMKTTIGEGLAGLAGSHKAHAQIPELAEVADFINTSSLKDDFLAASKEDPSNHPNPSIEAFLQKQLVQGDFFEPKRIRDYRQQQVKKQNKRYKEWSEGPGSTFREPTSEAQQKPLEEFLLGFEGGGKPAASREWSATMLAACAKHLPQLVGGSADLASSTKAFLPNGQWVDKENFGGRNLAFGVREHAMAAIGNGLALSGAWPFTSTFFAFVDYMKPAVRLAAIMNLKHLFIFSHDSFYVGEDGPTHQPVEQLLSLRLTPNITVFRPCNAQEMAFAYLHYLRGEGPVAIVASRQALTNERPELGLGFEAFSKGAYVFAEDSGEVGLVLVGSGSEMGLLLALKRALNGEGVRVRVVSAPSTDLFEAAGRDYADELFLRGVVPVLLCEAASYRSLGPLLSQRILVVSVNEFGRSGKASDVAKSMGFEVELLLERALEHIKQFALGKGIES